MHSFRHAFIQILVLIGSVLGASQASAVEQRPNILLVMDGKWMRQGDLKAVSVAPPYGAGIWHLYDVVKDAGETRDLFP